jgi:hypothetical protein
MEKSIKKAGVISPSMIAGFFLDLDGLVKSEIIIILESHFEVARPICHHAAC